MYYCVSFEYKGHFSRLFIGLRITYDLCRPPGQRVVSAYTRCRKCSYPRYSPLDDDKIYTIATLDFVIRGGDGFDVIRDHHTDHKRFSMLLLWSFVFSA